MPQELNMGDAEGLLPCPFCGGAVELEQTVDGRPERKWWGVVCRSGLGLGGTCAVQIRPSASKEAALERWNTRPTPAVPVEDAELVERLLREAAQDDGLARAVVRLAEEAGVAGELAGRSVTSQAGGTMRQAAARLTALSARNAVVEEALTKRPALPLVYDAIQLRDFNRRYCEWEQQVSAVLTTKETEE